MRALALLLSLLAGAAAAHADDAIRVELAIGETTSREVGFAQGLLCDDVTIVRAELKPHTADSNTLSLTGLAVGTTLCRAGTVPARPALLFEVHVRAALRPRK